MSSSSVSFDNSEKERKYEKKALEGGKVGWAEGYKVQRKVRAQGRPLSGGH